MVRYEIALILRGVSKPNLHSVLRQVCTTVLDQGNVIRKLENLGERQLPYMMRAHKEKFTEGRCVGLLLKKGPLFYSLRTVHVYT